MITHIRKKITSDEQSLVTTRETDDNTKRTHEKNKPKDKIKEYKHTDKMKKRRKEKAVESTESVKELALKIKGRELNQNSQSKPLKPWRDRAQKAPRTGP